MTVVAEEFQSKRDARRGECSTGREDRGPKVRKICLRSKGEEEPAVGHKKKNAIILQREGGKGVKTRRKGGHDF